MLLIGLTWFGHYYAKSLQTRHYSSLTAPNLQHTTNQERNNQCGNQQHSRELLMMGIVMPETCSVYKMYNKIISGIKLVFYSSVAANSLFLQCIPSIKWGITAIADHTQNSTKFCSSAISIRGSQHYWSAYLGTTGKCLHLNNKKYSWKHHIINYNEWITWKKPKIINYKSSNNVQ